MPASALMAASDMCCLMAGILPRPAVGMTLTASSSPVLRLMQRLTSPQVPDPSRSRMS